MHPVRQTNLLIPYPAIDEFCRNNGIRSLSLFGSVLRQDFSASSDVDILVEFEPGQTPGLEFFGMQRELSRILGRQVDLRTPADLSPHIRAQVIEASEPCFVHR
jgi:predicted nucleotidyltransferase